MSPSSQRPGTVEVPTRVLTALVALLVAGALTIAYLAGRNAGRREGAAAAISPGPAAAPSEPDPSSSVPAAPDRAAAPSRDVADVAAAPPPLRERETTTPASVGWEALSVTPTPAPGPSSGAASDPASDAVRRYFADLEAAESQGKSWSDPQSLAMTIVQQISTGDTSGLDRLVDDQRRVLDALRVLDVPEACREHHSRTVALLGAGVDLLQRLRDGAATGDLGGLVTLPDDARSLEEQARAVDVLAADIKRAHGIGG